MYGADGKQTIQKQLYYVVRSSWVGRGVGKVKCRTMCACKKSLCMESVLENKGEGGNVLIYHSSGDVMG